MRVTLLAIAIAITLVACGKKSDDGSEEAADFVAESATKDISKVEEAIAAGTPTDARFKCAHMANIADLKKVKKHEALAAKLEQVCTKELPLAIMKVEVEKAEAARRAKPDEQVLTECYNAEFDLAKQEMTEAKTIEAANDLVARFEAACPPQK